MIIQGNSTSGIHTLQGFQGLAALGLVIVGSAAADGCESLMIIFSREACVYWCVCRRRGRLFNNAFMARPRRAGDQFLPLANSDWLVALGSGNSTCVIQTPRLGIRLLPREGRRYSRLTFFSREGECRKVLSGKSLRYSGAFRLFSFIHGVNKGVGSEQSNSQFQTWARWSGAFLLVGLCPNGSAIADRYLTAIFIPMYTIDRPSSLTGTKTNCGTVLQGAYQLRNAESSAESARFATAGFNLNVSPAFGVERAEFVRL